MTLPKCSEQAALPHAQTRDRAHSDRSNSCSVSDVVFGVPNVERHCSGRIWETASRHDRQEVVQRLLGRNTHGGGSQDGPAWKGVVRRTTSPCSETHQVGRKRCQRHDARSARQLWLLFVCICIRRRAGGFTGTSGLGRGLGGWTGIYGIANRRGSYGRAQQITLGWPQPRAPGRRITLPLQPTRAASPFSWVFGDR